MRSRPLIIKTTRDGRKYVSPTYGNCNDPAAWIVADRDCNYYNELFVRTNFPTIDVPIKSNDKLDTLPTYGKSAILSMYSSLTDITVHNDKISNAPSKQEIFDNDVKLFGLCKKCKHHNERSSATAQALKLLSMRGFFESAPSNPPNIQSKSICDNCKIHHAKQWKKQEQERKLLVEYQTDKEITSMKPMTQARETQLRTKIRVSYLKEQDKAITNDEWIRVNYPDFYEETTNSSITQKDAPQWSVVLGVDYPCTIKEVIDAWRFLVKQHHPDQGGSRDVFDRINEARDQAITEFRTQQK